MGSCVPIEPFSVDSIVLERLSNLCRVSAARMLGSSGALLCLTALCAHMQGAAQAKKDSRARCSTALYSNARAASYNIQQQQPRAKKKSDVHLELV